MQAGWHDFDPTSPIPHTAILEIEIMEGAKLILVGNYCEADNRIFNNPQRGRVYSVDGICPTIDTRCDIEPKIMEEAKTKCLNYYDENGNKRSLEHRIYDIAVPVSCAIRGRNPDNPSDRRAGTPTEQRLELGGDVANCLTSVQKDSMVLTPKRTETAKELRRQGIEVFANRELVPREDGCSNTITTVQKDNLLQELYGIYDNQFGDFYREPIEGLARTLKADHHNAVLIHYRIRKLTPWECFRLMGVDDADIDKIDAYRISGTVKDKPIPKSQKYKLAGNSIVVDVLYHIFYQMFIAEPPKPQPRQLEFEF